VWGGIFSYFPKNKKRAFFKKKKERENEQKDKCPKLILKRPFVINKTRFYTRTRIKQTHEIALSVRSTTGIVFELLLRSSFVQTVEKT